MYRNCHSDEDPFVDPTPIGQPTRREAEQDEHEAAYRGKMERDAQLTSERQAATALPKMPASSRQLAYLADLVQQREVPAQVAQQILDRVMRTALTKSRASDWINRLRKLPLRTAPLSLPTGQPQARVSVEYAEFQTDKRTPGGSGWETRRIGYLSGLGDRKVPAGHYALKQDPDTHGGNDVAFYRLWIGERHGWQLYLCHGPESTPVNRASATSILRVIADNLEDSLALYGHRIGKCGVCSRRLTNKVSRDRGIGPVCYQNLERLF